MQQKFITKSFGETQKLGKDFAKKILESSTKNRTIVFGLSGNLGGGKTTFLQGFAKGLGIKEKILSPTFVIMKRFDNFYHFDCYRIAKPEEILELDFKNIIKNPKNIVAIEWPEKIKKVLPKNIVSIKFKFINKNKREISINKF